MKKQFIFVLLFLFLNFHFFPDIINWKGMEFGKEKEPNWLKAYIQTNDVKKIRKKFDIDSSQRVVVGIGISESLENARNISQIDAQRQFNENSKKNNIERQRLMFIYEYWIEDSINGFVVYSIYSY